MALPEIPKDKRPTKKLNVLKHIMLSPFMKKYRDKLYIDFEKDIYKLVINHTIMSGDKAFLYIKNSKAGCSTISQIIGEYTNGQIADPHLIHQKLDGVYFGSNQYYYRMIKDSFNKGDCVKFSFVRNPLSRVISSYFNFFVDNKNESRRKHINAIVARGYVEGGDIYRNFDVFVEYVEESILTDRVNTDRHWREQYINIGYGIFNLDFIGKVESFREDIKKVFEMAGKEKEYSRLKSVNMKLNQSSRKKEFKISAYARKKIERIYEKDYEIFGY